MTPHGSRIRYSTFFFDLAKRAVHSVFIIRTFVWGVNLFRGLATVSTPFLPMLGNLVVSHAYNMLATSMRTREDWCSNIESVFIVVYVFP